MHQLLVRGQWYKRLMHPRCIQIGLRRMHQGAYKPVLLIYDDHRLTIAGNLSGHIAADPVDVHTLARGCHSQLGWHAMEHVRCAHPRSSSNLQLLHQYCRPSLEEKLCLKFAAGKVCLQFVHILNSGIRSSIGNLGFVRRSGTSPTSTTCKPGWSGLWVSNDRKEKTKTGTQRRFSAPSRLAACNASRVPRRTPQVQRRRKL